jgi:hypothetical protein
MKSWQKTDHFGLGAVCIGSFLGCVATKKRGDEKTPDDCQNVERNRESRQMRCVGMLHWVVISHSAPFANLRARFYGFPHRQVFSGDCN